MADNHKRRSTAKGVLKRLSGKVIEANSIKSVDKVTIMEYLLQCPRQEMMEYNSVDIPTFIAECAEMLINNQIVDYMTVLEVCRKMAREDVNTRDFT